MQVIADADRFLGVELLHCPEHATDAAWVADARYAWAWTDAKRALTDYVREPSAALIDAIAVLSGAVAERDAEARRDPAESGA